ncbi:uncharacterized protein N7484_007733 [Penicillium longicatenatum]|uniref:uncharacterized protein n=1 Tax=Penicillium longicatenatum TaxID=1561947 RepID=UPI002546BB2D|nr:uncharacterized protein N7484_007733 [Penicillium longicatenatum]KAJ5639871.1 hypothetical protein N7484_007733 [Penicillium longicatenatum]
MLITPRTYSASQTPDRAVADSRTEGASRFYTLAGWRQSLVNANPAPEMLLTYQTGSVRVGEVVRYTLTYTPAADPILPLPAQLYVRVKNASAIPLRAAYLHGPYTLYASCYPSTFDPNSKYNEQETDGLPQFEPYLKAGGNWDATIKLPTPFGGSHNLAAGHLGPDGPSTVTWVIEIVSQVIFSNSAAVHFEMLVARDAKSLEFFSAGGPSAAGMGPPGKLQDHWLPGTKGLQVVATTGVFSKSITLRVDDTTSLWNSPPLPSKTNPVETGSGIGTHNLEPEEPGNMTESSDILPKKRIHLVVVTHGLHSNLGADMLYLKESIDAATNKVKKRKDQENTEADDEEIVVRGFAGNAVRTERGIQYLGKRLAKYILLMTYPDQPYFPLKGPKSKTFPRPFSSRKDEANFSDPHASVDQDGFAAGADHAYQITGISFIGHSLGGLIQTYAIAYIHKHSPHFFEQIRPVNFIALATPFLGLSNENPMYVRFALDLGLVGRTGQDLGLSWTAPKVRSGWGAIIGGRGDAAKDQSNPDPGSKPLLRILPCGPAHEALQKFQHRTVYSNVVNDGIVPLRTSCLLFLDWRGLDRVEKARRDNGIVGTMAEWGWAELTGANSKSPQIARPGELPGLAEGSSSLDEHEALALEDPSPPTSGQFIASKRHSSHHSQVADVGPKENVAGNASSGPLSTFLSLFRTKETKPPPRPKHTKIYRRSQTLASFDANESPAPLVRGNSLYEDEEGLHTPPKTTFFESAGDLLMPPLPPTDFILDPSARPRTIFHDRIYHSDDIPPPLPVKRRTIAFSSLQNKSSKAAPAATQVPSNVSANLGESGLKVEEKIARAYHRDLTWRKVLVRLEPDAHNNIIVRRMFTNAYGWPVVKHLVDTHFGHTEAVETDDTLQQTVERAKSPGVGPTSSGDEVEGQNDDSNGDPVQTPRLGPNHFHDCPGPSRPFAHFSMHERAETFPAEHESHKTSSTNGQSHYAEVSRQDSARWTDRQVDEDDNCESGLDEKDDAGFRWSPTLRP